MKYSDSHCISMLVEEAISARELLLPQGAAESHCNRQHTTGRDGEELRGGVSKVHQRCQVPGPEFTHIGEETSTKETQLQKSGKKICR